jgi:hypothetical protein
MRTLFILATFMVFLSSNGHCAQFCETDSGNVLPFEEFTDRNQAVLFAKGIDIEGNIIKEKGKEKYLVFLQLPKQNELCVNFVEIK